MTFSPFPEKSFFFRTNLQKIPTSCRLKRRDGQACFRAPEIGAWKPTAMVEIRVAFIRFSGVKSSVLVATYWYKHIPIGSMVLLYMVTFTINIPQMLAYIPYMDPMGYKLILSC